MIGEILTGLSNTEQVEITLECDESDIKTRFVIQNVPAGVDLEVQRVGVLFGSSMHPEHEGVGYGWLAFGLVKAFNWKEPGDEHIFKATEDVKTKNGKKIKRISVEYLINEFGCYAAADVRNELVNAIFTYNTLKPAERKNWTWPLKSNTSGETKDSPVSGQGKDGIKSQDSAETADSGSTQAGGIVKGALEISAVTE